jgi:DNA invertase Pin-like site-specific DNA recombinase
MARPRKATTRAYGTRAIVYLRVSKEDGPSKHGLDDQRTQCQRYVAERVYTVVEEVVDDGVSAAKRWQDRPGLSQAITRCMEHEADVIVAYDQDRFARKLGVFDDLRDVALLKGFRLETSDGRVLTHADDFTTGDVRALVAAIERRRTSERFQLARRRRSQQDGCGSGRLPWGYRWQEPHAPEDRPALAVDEQAAPTIRTLFALRRGGRGRKGLTYQGTADRLNAEGLLAPRGGQWTVGQVQAVEQREELYRTGTRRWDGVTASLVWPAILGTANRPG